MKKLAFFVFVILTSNTVISQRTKAQKDMDDFMVKYNQAAEYEANMESYRKNINRKFDSIKKIPQDTLSARFIKLLNQYRLANGLSSLKLDNHYMKACNWMTRYMDSCDILSHDINVNGMKTPWDRLAKFSNNTEHDAYGEVAALTPIFAWIQSSPDKTVEQIYLDVWLHSPAHKKILLKPGVKVIGVCLSVSRGSALVGYK